MTINFCILDSDQSDECVGFTMMYVFVFYLIFNQVSIVIEMKKSEF